MSRAPRHAEHTTNNTKSFVVASKEEGVGLERLQRGALGGIVAFMFFLANLLSKPSMVVFSKRKVRTR